MAGRSSALRRSESDISPFPQSLLAAVVQNQLDGRYETRARLFLGPTLTICARNLWTVGDVPLAVAFNDRRELARHGCFTVAEPTVASATCLTVAVVERATGVEPPTPCLKMRGWRQEAK